VDQRTGAAVALLSVKPEYVERIVAGSKRVEFRRTGFARPVSHVVLYATMPVGRLMAVCEVSAIHRGPPASLWRTFGTVGGIGADRYWAYYRGTTHAVAIGIQRVRRLARELSLQEVGIHGPPPQSYRYLEAATVAALMRRLTPERLPHG
jgi:predicted transcriptional regulator